MMLTIQLRKMLIDQIKNKLLESKVNYSENGSDLRNYRVTFDKVKNNLGFIPQFTIKDGHEDARPAIEIVHDIRNSEPIGLKGDNHQFANKELSNHPFK